MNSPSKGGYARLAGSDMRVWVCGMSKADQSRFRCPTKMKMMRFLLDRSADVDARDIHGNMPLDYAAGRKKKGCPIDTTRTPLIAPKLSTTVTWKR